MSQQYYHRAPSQMRHLQKNSDRALLINIAILTIIFIFLQLFILAGLLYINKNSVSDIVKFCFKFEIFYSTPIIKFLLCTFISQAIIYLALIYFIFFVTNSIRKFFKLNIFYTRYLGMAIWIDSVISILLANAYFVPHSYFSSADILTREQLKLCMYFMLIINSIIYGFALIYQVKKTYQSYKSNTLYQNVKNLAPLLLILGLAVWILPTQKIVVSQHSKNTLPNIFIISFDALRPDYIHYINPQKLQTPEFDDFLKQSVVFQKAYTPLSRTTPSWTSILTSQYPLHHHVRQNNIDYSNVDLSETLPKALRALNYKTVYATDDRTFNTVNENYGFDQVIGTDNQIVNFIVNVNDFPLSNLIIPTPIGKLLFPYNYANHYSSFVFKPENFLDKINESLPADQPLFLAVHFDLSGWPCTWFNDGTAFTIKGLDAYNNAVKNSDVMLGKFLTLLKQKSLLDNAIVILISDHGNTFGLRGESMLAKKSFQGNKNNIPITPINYLDSTETGYDTAYNYGTDIFSDQQNHTLLAFRIYGKNLILHRDINSRVSMLDITPTLLSLMNLPKLSHQEGISLKSYLFHKNIYDGNNRLFFFENAFAPLELMHANIRPIQLLSESINYFSYNKKTRLVALSPEAEKILLQNQQRGVIKGNLFLASMPPTATIPAYFIILNLETGQWTTDESNPLMKQLQTQQLKKELYQFYKNEMVG